MSCKRGRELLPVIQLAPSCNTQLLLPYSQEARRFHKPAVIVSSGIFCMPALMLHLLMRGSAFFEVLARQPKLQCEGVDSPSTHTDH